MIQTLPAAQALAWSLATTLMVCITLFRTEAGFGVMPSTEWDGEADMVIHEYDPWD